MFLNYSRMLLHRKIKALNRKHEMFLNNTLLADETANLTLTVNMKCF